MKTITRDHFDLITSEEMTICEECDVSTTAPVCPDCGNAELLISVGEWEALTGEEWVS